MHFSLGTTFCTSNISEAFAFTKEQKRGTITKNTPTLSSVFCARFAPTTALMMRLDPIVDLLQTHQWVLFRSSCSQATTKARKRNHRHRPTKWSSIPSIHHNNAKMYRSNTRGIQWLSSWVYLRGQPMLVGHMCRIV